MRRTENRPGPLASTAVAAGVATLWIVLRMVIFHAMLLPLTYVLPLMVCIWTRRRWHLYAMAVLFGMAAAVEYTWMVPDDHDLAVHHLGVTLLNIAIGAAAVHFTLLMRDRIEAQRDDLAQQNEEIRAQAEELAQQQEELSQQNEELAQQGEELQNQTEELEQQAEALQVANQELSWREETLQMLLSTSRALISEGEVLSELCRHGRRLLGEHVAGSAVVEAREGMLHIHSHDGVRTDSEALSRWPLPQSLAAVAMEAGRTGALENLGLRPDLRFPTSAGREPFRSVLAAPLWVGGKPIGALEFYATVARPWTEHEFRLAEWVAAQCSAALEAIRLRAEAERARKQAEAAEEQLRRTNERLESASRAKDHFLAVLSHELRTPLTPVLMSVSEMLADPTLPPAALEDLAMIRRNVELETRLIDDLLDVTRIARGKLELQRHPSELRRIITHAAETCTAEARAKGLELELQLGDEDMLVDADAARLQQVFWNLIKNAVKFTPAGKISVSCHCEHGQVVVGVADTGIGMEADMVERIFNAFEQGGTGTTRKFGGLGLGLAISKALVEMHQGTITACSKGVGCGSLFTVRLPLSQVRASAGTVPHLAAPARSAAGRVLLVEDHPDSARMLGRLLARSGWFVKTAGDVASALRTARAERFDLLISDIGLPDGTGLDLMRQLRLEQPQLRGIALSGHGMEADIQLSREAGFTTHLVKPVNPQALQQVIVTVLDGETAPSGETEPSSV